MQQYTVIAIIYADGSVQYIAIDGNGQPLSPQPNLSNAIPCPTQGGGGGNGGNGNGDCCEDYSTATLQTQANNLQQTANTTLNTISSTLSSNSTTLNNILSALTTPPIPQPYRTLHGIVGAGGTLPNPFTLPPDAISVEIVPLSAHPDTLAVFSQAQLLGNIVTDDAGSTIRLAALRGWKVERRQMLFGAYLPIGGNIQVAATTGGSVFVIYETI
jgi:hypothetical protein